MTIGILKATDLMKTVWPTVAPFAYSRYLARGRGAVLVPVGGIKLRADGSGIVDADARYVTSDDIASGRVILPPETVKEIEGYDPEGQVVFLFDEAAGVTSYCGAPSNQQSPKALYEIATSQQQPPK